MADPTQLDRTYHYVLSTFVERGQAPHYTEIAKEFSVSPDEGKALLHELMAAGLPNWLLSGTDLIGSVAPFNNAPTHYRVSVEGEQKWFAQCGLEATAISPLFPGKEVRVEAPCLASGEDLSFTMRDGGIESAAPDGIHFYVNLPIKKWYGDLPFA